MFWAWEKGQKSQKNDEFSQSTGHKREGNPDGPRWRAREVRCPQFTADFEITSFSFGLFMCSKFSRPFINVYVIKFHQASLQGMCSGGRLVFCETLLCVRTMPMAFSLHVPFRGLRSCSTTVSAVFIKCPTHTEPQTRGIQKKPNT